MGSVPRDFGLLVGFTVADPGAGNTFIIQPVVGERWLLHSVRFRLVTDANVAVRRVYYQFFDAAMLMGGGVDTGTQVAGLTLDYNLSSGITFEPFLAGAWHCFGLGERCLLTNGVYIVVQCENQQVGDTFSGINGLVEKWVDDD